MVIKIRIRAWMFPNMIETGTNFFCLRFSDVKKSQASKADGPQQVPTFIQ